MKWVNLMLIAAVIFMAGAAKAECIEKEPSIVYYSIGAQINIVDPFKMPSIENISQRDTPDDIISKEIGLAGLAMDLYISTIAIAFLISLLLKKPYLSR